jgi:hypothetical protein
LIVAFEFKDGDIIDIEVHSTRVVTVEAAEQVDVDEEVEEVEEDIHESENDKSAFSQWLRGMHSLEEVDKPLVHKVQDMLKYTFGSGSAWCDTRSSFMAADIVKMVANDLGAVIPKDFAGVRKTITKKKPMDKASRLKELKKASDEAFDELKKVPPVSPGDVVAAMKSLDSRFKEIQGTATEEAAKKLLVALFSKLSEEQLRKMVNKLSTKAKTKADKVAAIAAALFDKDTAQMDTMQKNLDATMSVIKDMTILLVERAGINAGGIKQIASAIMNQKLGAKGSGTALNINVDELITGMTKMGMDESDDDM